ncbi:MAG: hypothetical protein EYR95_18865, partial [Phormidium sp. SL48-SHIP]
MLPAAREELRLQGIPIHGQYKARIREAYSLPSLQQYEQKRFDWYHDEQTMIDWTTFRQTIRKFHTQKATIHKHVFHFSPTGHWAHQNNHHLPSSCPRCGNPNENNAHVLQCTDPVVHQWRQQIFPALKKAIQQSRVQCSDPQLVEIMQAGIHSYLSHSAPPNPFAYPKPYQTLVSQQNAIGWAHVWMGQFSTEWKIQADAYYRNNP